MSGSNMKMRLLAEKYEILRKKPFPVRGDVPNEIQRLHADMAVYSAESAGMITRRLEGKRFWRYDRNPGIPNRIRSLLKRYPEHSQLLLQYQQTYNDIQELIDLAEQTD